MSPSRRQRLGPAGKALPRCPRPAHPTTRTAVAAFGRAVFPLAVVACARLRRCAPPLRCSAPPASTLASGQLAAHASRACSLTAGRPRPPTRSRAALARETSSAGTLCALSSLVSLSAAKKTTVVAAFGRILAGSPSGGCGASRLPLRPRGVPSPSLKDSRAVLAAVKARRCAPTRCAGCGLDRGCARHEGRGTATADGAGFRAPGLAGDAPGCPRIAFPEAGKGRTPPPDFLLLSRFLSLAARR